MFHTDAPQALAHVQQLYREQIDHLRAAMQRFVAGETPAAPIHAYYPFVRIKTTTVAQADTKLTYGFVEGPAPTRPR
jgi:AMP nucleosidase